MDGRIIFLLVFQFFMIHYSGFRVKDTEAIEISKASENEVIQNKNTKMSSTQRDITTPLPTVPTGTPATLSPLIIQNSNPDPVSPSATMTPLTTPIASIDTGSWCVASESASEKALQVGLDYACGHGADCSVIQPGGTCYYPISIPRYASCAFNSYYQKNPVPNSCNFGGAAVLTSTDPSTTTCRYPSTSTSLSSLNTTNSRGFAVFGSGPLGPSGSSTTKYSTTPYIYILSCLVVFWLTTIISICSLN